MSPTEQFLSGVGVLTLVAGAASFVLGLMWCLSELLQTLQDIEKQGKRLREIEAVTNGPQKHCQSRQMVLTYVDGKVEWTPVQDLDIEGDDDGEAVDT